MRPSRPMPRADVVDVGADLLAQVGDLVDEGDLHRQEAVGGVFDELGGLEAGEQDRRLDQEQRAIELAHLLAPALALHPDHHAVGPHEIVDRGALAQELRIGDHVEVRLRVGGADDVRDLASGADRHRRLGHHDGIAVHRGGDLLGGLAHVGEVGVAVAAPAGRADRDEHQVGVGHRGRQVLVELEAPGRGVARHQRVQPGLIDRNLVAAQPPDLQLILVDAGDMVAELGEAGARYQADIAGPDHCDFHGALPPVRASGQCFRSCAMASTASRTLRPIFG